MFGIRRVGDSEPILAEPIRPTTSAVPGSTTDIQQQRAAGGAFTGAWKVMADGREVHRFSGIGNVQSDANRVAIQWLRNNGYDSSTEVEVLPIMS
jgi:hypothetical protein